MGRGAAVKNSGRSMSINLHQTCATNHNNRNSESQVSLQCMSMDAIPSLVLCIRIGWHDIMDMEIWIDLQHPLELLVERRYTRVAVDVLFV